MSEGVQLLNSIQDVYLADEITIAWFSHGFTRKTRIRMHSISDPCVISVNQSNTPIRIFLRAT